MIPHFVQHYFLPFRWIKLIHQHELPQHLWLSNRFKGKFSFWFVIIFFIFIVFLLFLIVNNIIHKWFLSNIFHLHSDYKYSGHGFDLSDSSWTSFFGNDAMILKMKMTISYDLSISFRFSEKKIHFLIIQLRCGTAVWVMCWNLREDGHYPWFRPSLLINWSIILSLSDDDDNNTTEMRMVRK